MGATDFTDIASGRTATQAYEEAVSGARYEYGNDPYNGTISTTNGFRELPEKAFKGLGRKSRLLILEAVAMGDQLKRSQLGAKAWHSYQWLRTHYRGTEKRGCCYAVRLNHNTFAFAGWAAC